MFETGNTMNEVRPALTPGWKRPLDLALAVPLLILASPVLVVVAVMVRLRLGSPVLFRQLRPGLHGQPFTIHKFRTMTEARRAEGELLPDAERLTSFGRALRATSLDEIPELWDVARGKMSLVGPRPLLMGYVDLYTARHARRHEVRPGITGWAQVNGRNAPSWRDKLEMDIWYVDNQSLLLDLKILFHTALTVVRGSGISQVGHATSERFRGGE